MLNLVHGWRGEGVPGRSPFGKSSGAVVGVQVSVYLAHVLRQKYVKIWSAGRTRKTVGPQFSQYPPGGLKY